MIELLSDFWFAVTLVWLYVSIGLLVQGFVYHNKMGFKDGLAQRYLDCALFSSRATVVIAFSGALVDNWLS